MDRSPLTRSGLLFWAFADDEPIAPRCPRCGQGEVIRVRVSRQDGAAADLEYCAGFYDRERRRYLRRGCGYSTPPLPAP